MVYIKVYYISESKACVKQDDGAKQEKKVSSKAKLEENNHSEASEDSLLVSTEESVTEDKEQEHGDRLKRVPPLAEDGGRTLAGVQTEDVSGVQSQRQAEGEVSRSSTSDVSGSGRVGKEGLLSSRSVGNGTREVHSSTTRTRSDGGMGTGRLENQKPEADIQPLVFGQREGLFDLPPVPITVIQTKGLPDDFKDMKKWADKLLRELQQAPIGTLHNEDMQADFVISKDDRKKMGNNRGLSHATSQAISGLSELVKHAIRAETHDDVKHHNTDVQAVHRLYAPAEIAGKIYRVKLTVKDYLFLDGSGKRQNLHAIEAVEIENAPMGIAPPNQNDQAAQPTSGRVLSITDLLRGASRDFDGQPFVQNEQEDDGKAKQEASQAEINRFIDDALAQNDPRGELPLWEVSTREVDLIKQQADLDVSGLWHTLDAQELKHALRKHGDDKSQSKKQAQENLTVEHLKRIPEVLRHFDEIEVQKRATNRSSLIYKKSFNDGTIEYVERVFETSAKKKPRLSTKTIWVVSPTAATAATQQVYTPERHQGNDTLKQSDTQDDTPIKDTTVTLDANQAVTADNIAPIHIGKFCFG